MPLLALKVDVHTRHGLLHGVPKLAELLAAAGASATFCLNVGPDRAGRVPAAEWLAKDSFKLRRQLPWSTRMAGRWWPGRQPGRAGRQVCQQLQAAGFELALAAWDQAAWRQEALTGEAEWSRKTLEHARTAFSQLTGQPRPVFGLPNGLAMLQAALMECLPHPPMSRDNVRSLACDNVSAEGFPQAVFGFAPSALTSIAPGWLGGKTPADRYNHFRSRAPR